MYSLPETNPLHVSDFTINLYGKYLTYAVLAIGVDVLWGFTGLLSLGQCLFFALGGYAFGMYLMLKIGKLGQYKSDLPDFMVFLGYNKLPAHWVPFNSFWFALAAVVLVPGIVALVFGYLAFRSRIRGVYFSILTQALTYGACLMFFRNDFTFGGNNGLTDFKFVLNYDVNSAATQRTLYMLSGFLLLGSYVFSRWLTTTKFGKVQRAIRDSENRVLFSGYATSNFKLFVFVYAAVISGLGGSALHPAGGNNQSERDVSGEVPRGRGMGGGGGTRHTDRSHHRFGRCQCAQELGNPGVSGPLAHNTGRTLCIDRPLHAQGHCGHSRTDSRAAKALPKTGVTRRRARGRRNKPKRRMKTEFILTAEGVNKSFDGFKAINDLNFYLDKGELRTIIGPNGAGKSTFLDLITGRTRPGYGHHRISRHTGYQTAGVRDLPLGNRPEVSNTECLFRPYCVRKHSAWSGRQPRRVDFNFRTRNLRAARTNIRGAGDHWPQRSSRR